MAQTHTAQSYELNLEEYWQVILRRRWIIIFCSLTIGMFSALFTWMNQPPALYSSSASIKIEASLNVAELFTAGRSNQSFNDIKTQLVLLQSYALMERVAQRIGIIPKALSSEEIRANADYVDDVLDLKDSVNASQNGDTGIIQISVVSVSSKYARDLAQAVADEFQTFNIEDKNKKVFEAKKFIEQQLVIVGDRLKKSEESIRSYRQKHHLTAFRSDMQVKSRIIGDLNQEYRQGIAHLNDLKFALKQLNIRVNQGKWDYKAVSVSGNVSSYFDMLNKRLVEMALKHTELSTNYTDQHPQIQELRQQAKDILSSMLEELAKQLELTQQRIQNIQDSIISTKQIYKEVPGKAWI